MGLAIEPLAAHHDRSAFSCGQPQLDEWFRQRASQDERRNVARVFVALDAELGVVGLYSLSSYTLALSDLPEEIANRLPRYDAIPAALIGRLARDLRARGRRVGELLLADAVRRVLGAGRSVAVFAIVVDAKDERTAGFYRGFGSFRSRTNPFGCSCPLRRPQPASSELRMGNLPAARSGPDDGGASPRWHRRFDEPAERPYGRALGSAAAVAAARTRRTNSAR